MYIDTGQEVVSEVVPVHFGGREVGGLDGVTYVV